jgi:glyoxylase-like metal-dependent hydrolase (beta-lactamase superfamily II)
VREILSSGNLLAVTSAALQFTYPDPPKPLELIEASAGIFWVRLPLPFRLDHVNVYLIEDGDGFTLIDAGIDNAVSREMWAALFDGPLRGKPITRVLATHCHPDHIGLAGWLCERFGLKLYASQTEYLETLCVTLDPGALNAEPYRSFYRANGLSETQTELLLNRGLHYLRMVSPLPRTFRRVIAGETLRIGGRGFEVITGGGHSSEQVMLHSAEQNVLLCADQALARISPNISVDAMDPDGDPLGVYLRSLEQLRRTLPEDVLALPGHNLPFVGLPIRVDELNAHHASRCQAILAACGKAPRSVVELVPVVFGRVIEDPHQMSFAFSEALAHANYLIRRDELRVLRIAGGVVLAAA